MGACDDVGVEKELLMLFQRLAKYPGVEENDLVTLSEAEHELGSAPESNIVTSTSDDASKVGNNGCVSSTTSLETSTRSTRFSFCVSIASTSWELPIFS